MLWFAFNSSSLTYFTHPHHSYHQVRLGCDLLSIQVLWLTLHIWCNGVESIKGVVICFQFKFFDLLYTSYRWSLYCCHSCDLLSIQVLWLTLHIPTLHTSNTRNVVICFQFKFFDLLYTSDLIEESIRNALWFAFNSSSLTYFTHLWNWKLYGMPRCDLLSIQVLWLTLHIAMCFHV